MDFLPGKFQKILKQLFFGRTNERVRPEIQTTLFLEHQWKHVDG